MVHELCREAQGGGLGTCPHLSRYRRGVLRLGAGEILGKRLRAWHTVECVHGAQGNFVGARVLQDVLQNVGHGGDIALFRGVAAVI